MRLPVSLGFFALAIGVFVLQLIPYTGVILMMFLAMFWPGFLINAGMIGLAVEALFRRSVSILWLAIPVIYIGGYAAAYQLSQSEFARLEDEVVRINAGQSSPIDRARDTLYLKSQKGGDTGSLAHTLVSRYGIGRVYAISGHAKHAGHKLHGIAPYDVCKAIDQNKVMHALGAGTFGISDGKGYNSYFVARKGQKPVSHCGYSISQNPGADERLIKIDVSSTRSKSWYQGNVVRETITVSLPDGRKLTLASGSASKLPPLPFPVAGCALNSGRPAWECSASFWLNGPIGFGDSTKFMPTYVPVLAKALGLSRTTLTDVAAYADAIKVDFDATYADNKIERSLDHVRELIANPDKYHYGNLNAFPGLSEEPEKIIPLVPQIIAELVRRVPLERVVNGNNWALQKLLSLLPDDVLKANLLPFVEALKLADQKQFKMLKLELVERLAAVGPAALPILERILRQKRQFDHRYAAIAVCRLGEQARPLGRVIQEINAKRSHNNFPVNYAYYVAALGIGDMKLAEVIRAMDPKDWGASRYDAALAAAEAGDRKKLCRQSDRG